MGTRLYSLSDENMRMW